MVTFVQAKYVLATFVHISNFLADTGPIFTKLFGGHVFLDQNVLGPNFFFLTQNFFLTPKIVGNCFWTYIFFRECLNVGTVPTYKMLLTQF